MFANAGGDLWLLMTVFGVIVLGAAIAYGMIRNRRGMTPEKRRVEEEATRRTYEAEQRDTAGRS